MNQKEIPETKIHSYNVSVAVDVGINAAIIFHNICFWVEQNFANERNFINDDYWTYNTVNAFKTMFPEMTYEQIRNALRKLEDKEYIKSAFLSKDVMDRTKYYAVVDFEKWISKNKCNCENSHMDSESSQMENGNGTDVNNIYNNKSIDTDNNFTNNKQTDNNLTDNAHKGRNINTVNGKADTSFPKKSLHAPNKKKTKEELKKLEMDMFKRFGLIGSQYDTNETAYVNTINAFRRYLNRYTERTGKVHPILKDETLEKIFVTLATISDTEYSHFDNVADYETDNNGISYLDKMVDEYFESEHSDNTDWHISYFARQEYLEKMAQHIVDY